MNAALASAYEPLIKAGPIDDVTIKDVTIRGDTANALVRLTWIDADDKTVATGTLYFNEKPAPTETAAEDRLPDGSVILFRSERFIRIRTGGVTLKFIPSHEPWRNERWLLDNIGRFVDLEALAGIGTSLASE